MDELLGLVTAKAQEWLGSSFDEKTREEVKALLAKEDKADLIDAFYKDLEFGTGGLRGIMGAGTNRMNIYTVGMATQGLANYLNKNFKNLKQISVVVGHDCRNNGRLFAETVANIFSANGIKVYLFDTRIQRHIAALKADVFQETSHLPILLNELKHLILII